MGKKDKKIEEFKEEEQIIGSLIGERIIVDSNEISRELYDKSRLGEPTGKNEIQYNLLEALFLSEKGKLKILEKKKEISFNQLVKLAEKLEPGFWIRYCVYQDLRKRGYIVKTALKFGADFRVYERGVKPGEDHAKWVVYPVYESNVFSWYDFAAKNRVAHSTRKRLLIAIVDEESDVTYYEINWVRP